MGYLAEMERTQPQILGELINALSQASGGASVLIHLLQDPRFIIIRDTLDLVKEGCIELAPQALKVKPRESKKSFII